MNQYTLFSHVNKQAYTVNQNQNCLRMYNQSSTTWRPSQYESFIVCIQMNFQIWWFLVFCFLFLQNVCVRSPYSLVPTLFEFWRSNCYDYTYSVLSSLCLAFKWLYYVLKSLYLVLEYIRCIFGVHFIILDALIIKFDNWGSWNWDLSFFFFTGKMGLTALGLGLGLGILGFVTKPNIRWTLPCLWF